jgi:tetratricopeptide (TPR) repeat protein
MSLNNLGMAYKTSKCYEAALVCYEESCQLAQKDGRLNILKQVLRNIGNLYYTVGDYAKSVAYFEQLLAVARDRLDCQVVNKVLRNLSMACYSLGDLSSGHSVLATTANPDQRGWRS